MTAVSLTINGETIADEIEPRQHLADYLRECRNLTATHIGCEHGICGACTILIDGAPARSCIAYPAALDGVDIRTIEGLRDDPVTMRLRAAFKQEHALQCGYCTPGMLVTARDIVMRLPQADERMIRLELAGNLCRCTGYAGIVRAIQRVLAEHPSTSEVKVAAVQAAAVAVHASALVPVEAPPPAIPGATTLRQSFDVARPRKEVWAALQDPQLIADCLPGARISLIEGCRISGAIDFSLGPIKASITGNALIHYGDDQKGSATGEGNDQASQSRLSAKMDFAVLEKSADASTIAIDLSYALRGSLAQLGRPAIVSAFAAEIGRAFASNLEARLAGKPAVAASSALNGIDLFWSVLKSALRSMLGRWKT